MQIANYIFEYLHPSWQLHFLGCNFVKSSSRLLHASWLLFMYDRYATSLATKRTQAQCQSCSFFRKREEKTVLTLHGKNSVRPPGCVQIKICVLRWARSTCVCPILFYLLFLCSIFGMYFDKIPLIVE